MPDGCVSCTRGGKWGNPHPVGKFCLVCGESHTRAESIAAFRRDLHDPAKPLGYGPDDVRSELRGKDLACWCKLDCACHADVLLEIANA